MNNVQNAVDALRRGGVVAFPTETVYGLGADARNETALNKIFALKNRPKNNPLIVHIGTMMEIHDWADEIPSVAFDLAEKLWPGPLTLILKVKNGVSKIITAGQETIGIRMPSHPVALELLHAFGRGVAAPSANKYTKVSATNAKTVYEDFGHSIDEILDGGDCAVGVESTILDLSSDEIRILRPGMIGEDEIMNVIKRDALKIGSDSGNDKGMNSVRVPGMHKIHYAPRVPAYQVLREKMVAFIASCHGEERLARVGFLIYSDVAEALLKEGGIAEYIKLADDAKLYARDLYASLRRLDSDELKLDRIIIERPPEESSWLALIDRITKATQNRFVDPSTEP